MSAIITDPYEFVFLTNEHLQYITVDSSLEHYTSEIMYTFESTPQICKKLIQANKNYVIFEDSNERFLFSKNTKEIRKITSNYIFDICIDLANLKYGEHTIIGDVDNVIRSLSQNFEYICIEQITYGFCKIFDSYVIIKIDENFNFTHITNHCGPTDIRPFDNGKYLEVYDNKPVIRNSERLFIIDIEQKSIFIGYNFGTLSSGMLFLKTLYYNNGSLVSPKRPIQYVYASSDKISIVRNMSNELFVLHAFDELYSSVASTSLSNTKMRHFLFVSINSSDLTSILQQLKTRSAQLIISSTGSTKFTIVSTCIRMDSFLNSVKTLFLQHSMYMYHDFIYFEFDSFDNAQMFTQRFIMSM